MRRVLLGACAVAMVLSAGMASALAAGPGHGLNFTDTDGDGVCDYASSSCHGWCADVQRDWSCRWTSQGQSTLCTGCGANFTDADGDGICDFCAACPGTGHGHGFRGGHHG